MNERGHIGNFLEDGVDPYSLAYEGKGNDFNQLKFIDSIN
jgi:hypothetical protein